MTDYPFSMMPIRGPLAPGTYFGTPLRSRTVGGFILTENVYQPDQHIAAHAHEHAFFYLVLDGLSHDHCRGRSRSFAAHSLAYHPPGEKHANRWDRTGGRCFHFELPHGRIDLLAESAESLGRPGQFTGGIPVWLAASLYQEFHATDAAAPLAMEGLLLELLASVSRCDRSPQGRALPRWLLAAREMLLDRVTEEISITELAGEAGVHPSHFSRAFRRGFGCSVGEFVRRARLEHACTLLVRERHPVARAAIESGFYDQSHFSRSFKRAYGMTPTQFVARFGTR